MKFFLNHSTWHGHGKLPKGHRIQKMHPQAIIKEQEIKYNFKVLVYEPSPIADAWFCLIESDQIPNLEWEESTFTKITAATEEDLERFNWRDG